MFFYIFLNFILYINYWANFNEFYSLLVFLFYFLDLQYLNHNICCLYFFIFFKIFKIILFQDFVLKDKYLVTFIYFNIYFFSIIRIIWIKIVFIKIITYFIFILLIIFINIFFIIFIIFYELEGFISVLYILLIFKKIHNSMIIFIQEIIIPIISTVIP